MVPAAKLSITTSERAHEAPDDLPGGLAAQVEGQAALVGVVDLEQAVGVGGRLDVGRVERQAAEQAEVLGRLQAHHVGAEVGEQLGAVGAGPDPGEVADADALEGRGSDGRPAGPVGASGPRSTQPSPSCAPGLGGGAAQAPPGLVDAGSPGPGSGRPSGSVAKKPRLRSCSSAASWSIR